MASNLIRNRSTFAAALMLLATGALAAAEAVVPPPPDPAVRLADELQRALDAGSNAAIINFIARHPDEALTNQARARLAAREMPTPSPTAVPMLTSTPPSTQRGSRGPRRRLPRLPGAT